MTTEHPCSLTEFVLEFIEELPVVSVRGDDDRVLKGGLHFLFIDCHRFPRVVVVNLKIQISIFLHKNKLCYKIFNI